MSFDNQTLEHLKKLCRIECSPEEEADILDSLKKVLAYVAQLQEVDTEGVRSCRYVLRSMAKLKLREDAEANTLSSEVFLNLAPEQIGGMVRIPPVMKPPV
jgi:aspartyl-tRNA(Asn)/glutamyl-tRNA(Gln) amidotransferase subunit C